MWPSSGRWWKWRLRPAYDSHGFDGRKRLIAPDHDTVVQIKGGDDGGARPSSEARFASGGGVRLTGGGNPSLSTRLVIAAPSARSLHTIWGRTDAPAYCVRVEGRVV
jgi:hypothetical protein